MKIESDDRRVRKTKKALAKALTELMLEKDIEKISVRELCDRADVHRATFYSHYSDIFELYEKIENYVVDEIKAVMAEYEDEKYPLVIKRLVDFVRSNSEVFNLIMNSGKSQRFYDKMLDVLLDGYFKTWDKEKDIDNYPKEYIYMAKYHLHGYMKLIAEWIKDGFAVDEGKIIKMIMDIGGNFDDLITQKYII